MTPPSPPPAGTNIPSYITLEQVVWGKSVHSKTALHRTNRLQAGIKATESCTHTPGLVASACPFFFFFFFCGHNWLSDNWVRGQWVWVSAEAPSSLHQLLQMRAIRGETCSFPPAPTSLHHTASSLIHPSLIHHSSVVLFHWRRAPVVFVFPLTLYLISYSPSKQQSTATGGVPTPNLLKAALDRATVQMPDKLKWLSDVALSCPELILPVFCA